MNPKAGLPSFVAETGQRHPVMSLQNVPPEIVAMVADNLDLDDFYNLSICCKRFSSLIYDQGICRRILQATHSSALGAQHAHGDVDYARELRRLVKRREAISSASPFLTALVALAESWLYEKGVLCHIRERTLRLLDIHNSADHEIVINIRKLLDEAIPESRGCRKYKFQLLYQADGVVSCLYTHKRPDVAHWLVVFQPAKNKIVTARRLESSNRIFVRNNSKFLFYGTQSDMGADRFRRWVLRSFNLQTEKWVEDPLYLPNTVGSDIGSTICFEIIDGYFCVLANSTSFEIGGLEYTSYYDFFRFPLDHPSREHMEIPAKRNLFRRQHAEGPIDDRWTFLKIFKDETSGETRILESRKEWLSGNSSATRTYYTKTLAMTEKIGVARDSVGSDEDMDSDDDQYPENDQLAQFFNKRSKGNHGRLPNRDPREVHVGDDASTSIMFTLSKCFIRSYHPSSQSFLDLVDDPHFLDPWTQRIRVRAGARRLRADSDIDSRLMSVAANDQHPWQKRQVLQQQIDIMYEQGEVSFWPPDTASPVYDDVHNILNPPGYHGNVHGTWDDRSLVYAIGGSSPKEGIKALVLVSFDPGIYLKGVRSFDDRHDAGPSIPADLSSTLKGVQAMLSPDKGKGKEKEKGPFYDHVSHQEEFVVEHNSSASSGGTGLIGEASNSVDQTSTWASTEPAQYLSIGQGVHFAK